MSAKAPGSDDKSMFGINTWLWTPLVGSSVEILAFTARFAALRASQTATEVRRHCHALQNALFSGRVMLSHMDYIRFWFQYGCCLRGKNLFHEAFDAFYVCLRGIKEEDGPEVRLQILTKSAAVNMNLTYYLSAIQDFVEIINILDAYPEIPFTKGNAEGMRCNAYIQLANCYLGLGYFEVAYRYVANAAQTLNDRFVIGTNTVLAPQATLADFSSRSITFLPLPDAILAEDEPDAGMWMALYDLGKWVYGLVLMWECRISKEHYSSKPRYNLKNFLNELEGDLYGSAVELTGKRAYRKLKPGARQNYQQVTAIGRFGVEAVFTLCKLDMLPLETGLIIAQEFLDLAKETHENTPEPERLRHFLFAASLLEYQCNWYEISALAQTNHAQEGEVLLPPFSDKIRDLIIKIEQHIEKYLNAGIAGNAPLRQENDLLLRQIIGCYYVLLAQLNLAIQQDARAVDLLHAAIDIFAREDDGFKPRLLEAELLLGEDDEDDG